MASSRRLVSSCLSLLTLGLVLGSGIPASGDATLVAAVTALSDSMADASVQPPPASVATNSMVSVRGGLPQPSPGAPQALPKILIVGTGVQASLLDEFTIKKFTASSTQDTVDPFGYGTLAASVILQTINADITSASIMNGYWWGEPYIQAMAAKLEAVAANAANYDLVLLAFLPAISWIRWPTPSRWITAPPSEPDCRS